MVDHSPKILAREETAITTTIIIIIIAFFLVYNFCVLLHLLFICRIIFEHTC